MNGGEAVVADASEYLDMYDIGLVNVDNPTSFFMHIRVLAHHAKLLLCMCCKPGPLPIGRSLIPRACRQDTLYGHTCWGNQRYTSTTYSIGDLDERAILPRMSSYRVLHHDYMRTLELL